MHYRVKAAARRKDSHAREHSTELHLNVILEGFSETMDGETDEQHLLPAEQGQNLGGERCIHAGLHAVHCKRKLQDFIYLSEIGSRRISPSQLL